MIEPEHQPLKDIYAYWLKKKGDKFAPSRADIDPADIPLLLPYIGLVDVQYDPLRFRYRLTGTQIIDEYRTVAESGKPLCAIWDYQRNDGRHLRYERLALPLSSDGKTVDMLFGGGFFEKAFG